MKEVNPVKRERKEESKTISPTMQYSGLAKERRVWIVLLLYVYFKIVVNLKLQIYSSPEETTHFDQ